MRIRGHTSLDAHTVEQIILEALNFLRINLPKRQHFEDFIFEDSGSNDAPLL